MARVWCSVGDCGASIPADFHREPHEVDAAWNRRAPSASDAALRAALKEARGTLGNITNCGYSSYGCKCPQCAILARIDSLLAPAPSHETGR